ncbi:Fe-S oxidoreductase-like protein in Rubrerythrin cluster [hydrothermal vent metagenome]|uniref:Fe-S oxidoreductase-like protein in Rubrerythrin cluster n=1 Tax=hydrothermal vent metagenome TaxID=652676 RepID=A0A3B0YMV2_9ZZZZ
MSEKIVASDSKAPTRHILDWKNPDFYNEDLLNKELERVFDICHGCRSCLSLCEAFPTLFDLVDDSETMAMDGVDKKDYMKVVDECYLCDLCFLSKCPFVPPHVWNIDFPHLMLRGKAIKLQKQGVSFRDKILSSTDKVGKLAGIPIVSSIVNATAKTSIAKSIMGLHKQAIIPKFYSKTFYKSNQTHQSKNVAVPAGRTTGKVALFSSCYGNRNEPVIAEDLLKVFEHNGIEVKVMQHKACCGMPKLELGDLNAVEAAKNINIPHLEALVDEGYDIVTPIPSCTLMFKQEIPLMFADEVAVNKIRGRMFDPFEYLAIRHKHKQFNTEFKNALGKVVLHVACHQRVQRIGFKTREILRLVPDTKVQSIELCSGHDGTYAVKKEFHEHAVKIGRPVANKLKRAEADHFVSDCVMAAHHIADIANDGTVGKHPLSLLRLAYGI